MKLVTFHSTHALHVGALAGERIVDLSAAGIAATIGELIRLGADGLKAPAQAVADPAAPSVALRAAKLAPPIVPGKILCSGINYQGHAAENPNAKMPTEPFFFAKLPSDVVSTGTPAGVGLFRNPQVFMQPGDVVEIEAGGIGVLRNTIAA